MKLKLQKDRHCFSLENDDVTWKPTEFSTISGEEDNLESYTQNFVHFNQEFLSHFFFHSWISGISGQFRTSFSVLMLQKCCNIVLRVFLDQRSGNVRPWKVLIRSPKITDVRIVHVWQTNTWLNKVADVWFLALISIDYKAK